MATFGHIADHRGYNDFQDVRVDSDLIFSRYTILFNPYFENINHSRGEGKDTAKSTLDFIAHVLLELRDIIFKL